MDHPSFSLNKCKVYNKRFEEIRKRKGALTTRTVLEDARDPQSPLHDAIDWDSTRCTERDLLRQAGAVIKLVTITITVKNENHKVRNWLSIKIDEGEKEYRPLVEISKSPILTEQIISSMKIELEAMLRRYDIYKEFLAASKFIKKAIEKLPRKNGPTA